MSNLKAIPDEELAKYVEEKLQRLDGLILGIGQGLDGIRRLTEEAVTIKDELKNAIRDGVFQRRLKF